MRSPERFDNPSITPRGREIWRVKVFGWGVASDGEGGWVQLVPLTAWTDERPGETVHHAPEGGELVGILPAEPGTYRVVTFDDGGDGRPLGYEYPDFRTDWDDVIDEQADREGWSPNLPDPDGQG